jgi:hypothetical protein
MNPLERCLALTLTLALTLAACHRGASSATPRGPMPAADRTRMEGLANFLVGDARGNPQLSPERFAELLLAGLGELELGDSAGCIHRRARVGELNNAPDPGRRIELEAGALEDCTPACRAGMLALAHASLQAQTAAVAIASCPGDTLLAPALGPAAATVHGVDYLYARSLLERAHAAVEADGSAPVRAHWDEIARALPRLGAGLAGLRARILAPLAP